MFVRLRTHSHRKPRINKDTRVRKYKGRFVYIVRMFDERHAIARFEDDRTNMEYVIPLYLIS